MSTVMRDADIAGSSAADQAIFLYSENKALLLWAEHHKDTHRTAFSVRY